MVSHDVPETMSIADHICVISEGKIVDRQEGKAGKERFVEMMQRALL